MLSHFDFCFGLKTNVTFVSLSSDLECKFDDNEGIVRFINHCDKCGKVSEVVVPQSSILRDFQKEK